MATINIPSKKTLTYQKKKKLMLHAYEIKFIINSKKYSFKADLPEYFKNFLVKNNFKQKDF